MTPSSIDLPVPGVALAVGAHPDDIEFGCGATLAKWAAAGCRIHHLVCTDGSKGSWDPDDDLATLVARRQDEQRQAALLLGGAGEVTFLGWPDGELESGLRQRGQVAHEIRRVKPEVVLGHDPWRRYRLHPDHRNAGFLVTDGIVAARDPHFFPEQAHAPHRPRTLLLWEAEEPDHLERVEDQLETKLAALLAHRSQFRTTMGIGDPGSGGAPDADEAAAFRRRVTQRLADQGASAGVGPAEAFRIMCNL
jgi:LmbE family N-acetylglucosaminyl deacetylase